MKLEIPLHTDWAIPDGMEIIASTVGGQFSTVTLFANRTVTVRGSDLEPVKFEEYRESVVAFERYRQQAISQWEGSCG